MRIRILIVLIKCSFLCCSKWIMIEQMYHLYTHRGQCLSCLLSGLCWATWDHSTQWRYHWENQLGKKKKPKTPQSHIFPLNTLSMTSLKLYTPQRVLQPTCDTAILCFGCLTPPWRADTLIGHLHCMLTTQLGNSVCY